MRKTNWMLITIVALAALLRLLFLGSHMRALYGDEIAIGYNAYSILKTGRDEFGRFMPLQFESWGDQKNPVYIYAVALIQAVTGPTAVSVRLPSALAGILAVYLTYLLVRRLKLGEGSALSAAFLLAVTPWHIHISRGGYEANLALTFGLLSIYNLLMWFEKKSSKQLIISAATLVLATYTYYTTKLFAPLLLASTWVWGWFAIKRYAAYYRGALMYWSLALVCVLPVIYLALFAGGQARFAAINIFRDPTTVNRVIRNRNFFASPNGVVAKLLENKYTYNLLDFTTYYFDNFSGQFLFVGGDSNVRYGLANHGMLYLLDAPLILMGILILYHRNRKAWLLLITWLLLAPLPTALVGKAYGLRSLAMLPVLQIFAGYALSEFFLWAKKRKAGTIIYILASLFYLLSVTSWLLRYINQYPTYGRYWYDVQVQEEILYAKARESTYDHLMLSNAYGKTAIYYAFYERIDPAVYRASQAAPLIIDGIPATQIGKYYFADLRPNGRAINQMDLSANMLIIADPTFSFADTTIKAVDDGRLLFKVYSIPPRGQL